MLEDYWRLMPEYQNVQLEALQPLRILFGFFPTYRQVALSFKTHVSHRQTLKPPPSPLWHGDVKGLFLYQKPADAGVPSLQAGSALSRVLSCTDKP